MQTCSQNRLQIGAPQSSVGAFPHYKQRNSSKRPFSTPWSNKSPRRITLVRAEAEEDEEAAFEKRLADLKKAKGETPYGEGKKKAKLKADKIEMPVDVEYSGETIFYEGSPHSGDLAVNLLLGVTILWLPLTFASVGRKAFVKYKFSDKRISITTTAPWEKNQTDVAYSQVRDVVAIGRGIGAWGDMVITLKNGDKLEIRSLDKWQEIKAYILERKAEVETSKDSQAKSGFSA